MRILGEIVVLVLGIALTLVIARGLGPIAPALGGVLRLATNPLVIVLVVALLLLFRVRRRKARTTKSARPTQRDVDANERGL